METKFIPAPKELMSNSLQDVLPDEEETSRIYHESFITVALLSDVETNLFGSLVGIELDENLKLDIRVSINEAFNFMSAFFFTSKKYLQSVILSFEDQITKAPGPFRVKNIKIIELDATGKVCVLAVDLIKREEKNA